MPTPSDHVHQRQVLLVGERALARIRDAELTQLGLVASGVAAVAPHVEGPDGRLALAEYVLGAVERTGLSGAFRALAVNDAIASSQPELCRLLGAVLVEGPTAGGPPQKRWAPPPGTPALAQPEGMARQVAHRLVTKETSRQEGGPGE